MTERITLRLTMGQRTYDLLWEALTNHADTVRYDDPERYSAADHAAYQRLMTSVAQQRQGTR